MDQFKLEYMCFMSKRDIFSHSGCNKFRYMFTMSYGDIWSSYSHVCMYFMSSRDIFWSYWSDIYRNMYKLCHWNLHSNLRNVHLHPMPPWNLCGCHWNVHLHNMRYVEAKWGGGGYEYRNLRKYDEVS